MIALEIPRMDFAAHSGERMRSGRYTINTGNYRGEAPLTLLLGYVYRAENPVWPGFYRMIDQKIMSCDKRHLARCFAHNFASFGAKFSFL
ncbi:hypothetical protein [Methylocaldum sp. 14B]|jgi:hypothetical protein|uniref:hypothetical protein n=1 Tax=unclassified Methylocaldum TaxID=2622260 RepID=UPI00098B91B5|nr:hypothetical protein [Methylocaldum sp. 14B]MDV3240569.1 hypothetical protein [Methylocaldum sp.]MVF20025.1 hypothetical protein [Methylocaldum sp. BRCS4]